MIREPSGTPSGAERSHVDDEQDADFAANAHVWEEAIEQDDRPLSTALGSNKSAAPSLLNARSKKTAAWADPDDQNIQVSLASDKRLRKLRGGPQEDQIGGRDYEARLRRQYGFGLSVQCIVLILIAYVPGTRECTLFQNGQRQLETEFTKGNGDALHNRQNLWCLNQTPRHPSLMF